MIPFETSVENSQPVELYKFDGTHRSYHFTSDSIAHIYGGATYVPVAGLVRTDIQVGTQEDEGRDLTVSIPIDQQIVKDYGFQITPPKLELTIFRKDRSNNAAVVAWKGQISAIGVDEDVAKFECPPIFSLILGSDIPNVAVQPMCNHRLYDSRCRVDRNLHRVATVVTEVVTSTVGERLIRVASRGAFAANYFKNGEMVVTTTGERRSIVAESSSNIIIVNYEFSKISVGTPVEIFAGCDHGWFSNDGCVKFNNQVNFGGFPFIRGESNNVFVTGP